VGVRLPAFDQAHGFAVNLFVVVALTVIAVAFVSGRPPGRPRSRGAPGSGRVRQAAALGAVGLIALGTTLMSLAQANPDADPILAESIARPSAQLNYPAPAFTLTSQYGQPVSLSSLRGKVLLLSFINPDCQGFSCPAIGPELRQATRLLGGNQVELAGVVLSPAGRSVRSLQAFDQREGLNLVPGWLYLTGTLAQLRQVWHEYGTAAQDEIYVIDSAGHVRQKYGTGAGPGTAATDSSFAVLLADAARHAMGS
jgi:cytochrome oxidase Cu insertion factor (SCO1/SenC/PrrC family)